MSTLSFSCPKCQKVHSNIKPELVGHKVKCQCGFVFRLGPKTDKQPRFDRERKRKPASKQAPSKAARNPNVQSASQSPDGKPSKQAQKPLPSTKLDEKVLGPLDVEPILEPIEVAGEVRQTYKPSSDEEFLVHPIGAVEPGKAQDEEIPIMEPIASGPLPVADFFGASSANDFADPFSDQLADVQRQDGAPLAAGLPTRAPQPKKKRVKKRPLRAGETRLKSNAGPTVSLIVSILGLISMIAVVTFLVFALMRNLDQRADMLFLSDSQKSWMTFALIRTAAMLVLGSLLAVSILASGVTAVMEMTQERKIAWAHMLSAILATIFMLLLLFYLVTTLFQLYSVANDAQYRVIKSKMRAAVFITIFAAIGMGIAPLAVAITGFIRGRK